METKLTFRRKFFFSMIIVGFVFAPVFLLLETYTRLFHDYWDLEVMTGVRAGPNAMKEWADISPFFAYRARPGNYGHGKTVNRHGHFSTPDLSLQKPSDTIRILFLGGSSTAGTGRMLADQDTWPWRTVQRLREKTSKKIDFINGAVSGYTTFESYGRFWSRLRYFHPDIVVVYHGWNEMYYFDDVDKITAWRTLPDGSWHFDRTPKPVQRIPPHWLDPYVGWSQILTRVRLRLLRSSSAGGETPVMSAGKLAGQYDTRGLEVFRTNLKLFKSTAQIIGARLFVAKQATLIVPALAQEQRKRCVYQLHGFDHKAHVDAFKRIYQIIDEEFPAESIIDVTGLSGNPDYFYDHIHPTEVGAEAISRIMSDSLAAYIQD